MTYINLQPIGLFLLCAINIGLATLILLHNRHSAVNKLFALSVFTVVGWIVSISLSLSARNIHQTIFLGRLAFAFASAIPFTLLWMFQAFKTQSSTANARKTITSGIFCLIFVFSSFTPFIVAGAEYASPRPNLIHGPLYPLFALYITLFLFFALYTLWRNFQEAGGFRRLQLWYLLLGLLIGGMGVIVTNLLIPLLWKTSRYSVVGPYFSLVFVSFSAHAIIRYHLMDIRVFVRKGVVYFGAITIAAFGFLGLANLLSSASGYDKESIPLNAAVAIAVMVAVFFQPFKRWLQDSLNRYLYRHTYDYQRTLREASRRLSTILDLDSLLSYLTEVIVQTLKVEMVAVFLRDDHQQAFSPKIFQRAVEWRQGSFNPILCQTSPLVEFLEREKRPLARDEWAAESDDQLLTAAVHELQALGGDVAFPFLQDRTPSGLLIVGPKLSGDPYFAEDIDLLSTLVGQAAIAIKNAQLYQEVALVNEYVANIVATMENGVVAIDTNGKVTLFNPAAERITGLARQAIRSRQISSLPAALAHPLQATLTDGQPNIQAETTIPDAVGRYTPVSCSTYALRDRPGNVLGAVAVFSDLSRLKELEGEKRRAERLASIGALASGIAHEIKNPLVAIKTFAELLPERFTEKDFREDFSKVVIREIARIDDLVARLRGLATPAARQLPSLDLRAPIDETLVLLRGQLEQKRIRVRRLYDRVLPQVAGDPAQLKQLFLNLFMNALEAMEAGGELAIRLARQEGAVPSSLRVEVNDTGTGIPHEMLGRIFDPFVTTKPGGSGLGLAICRGIADAHRATIHAENNPNHRGTTVTIEFVATEEMPAAVKT